MLDEWASTISDRIARASRWVDPKSMKRLVQIYAMEDDHEAKTELKDNIDSILGIHESRFLDFERPVLAPFDPSRVNGELSLGECVVGDEEAGPCEIPINSLTRHWIIYAQTGHAKTTIIYNIADQLSQLRIPYLWFDLKEDGRKLHRQQPDLIVTPWRKLRWNPLRNPPSMDLKEYWGTFAQATGRVWGTFHAGPNYLLEHLEPLYERYQTTGRLPTILDLYDSIVSRDEKTRTRTDYYDVIYNRMHTLVSTLGSTFRHSVGVPLEELLKHPVCLELNQLKPDEQNWIVEIMLMWIYHHRLAQRHRGEQLRHVIILDECHRWFYGGKEYSETTHEMGMPPIDTYPTQFRDFGEGLLCTTNMPSRVSQSLHSNTLVKIAGNLGSGLDVDIVSEAMGLDDEQSEMIHKLKRAEWIVKLSDYYTEPFMIVTPDHAVDTGISDEEVLERFSKMISVRERETAKPQQTSVQTVLPRISEDAKALLLDVNNHPFRGVSKRHAVLGFSGRRGELAKAELIQKNLVSQVEVRISQHRPTKFLIPCQAGLKLLKTLRQSTRLWAYIGHVSFEHRLHQVLSAYKLREDGYQTKMEYDIGDGRRLDVHATRNGSRIGVEITLNSNVDLQKILASLQVLDKLYLVCGDRQVQAEAEAQCDSMLQTDARSKVQALLFNQFLAQ